MAAFGFLNAAYQPIVFPMNFMLALFLTVLLLTISAAYMTVLIQTTWSLSQPERISFEAWGLQHNMQRKRIALKGTSIQRTTHISHLVTVAGSAEYACE